MVLITTNSKIAMNIVAFPSLCKVIFKFCCEITV